MASHNNDDDIFGPALTDFMSGVAVVFLCLAVAYIVIAKKKESINSELIRQYKEQIEVTNNQKAEFLEELKRILKIDADTKLDTLSNECFEIKTDGFKVTLRFKDVSNNKKCAGISFEKKLFIASRDSKVDTFLKVAKKSCEFQRKRTKDKRPFFDRIELLGHTDCNTFSPKPSSQKKDEGYGYVDCAALSDSHECGNLGLSALRARQVFLYLSNSLDDSDQDCLNKFFKVSGRGSFEPVEKDCKADSNRRVEFVFYIQPPEFKAGG